MVLYLERELRWSSGFYAHPQVQLTMVLYHQREYNRARRWRLPKCTLAPGEYQGFEAFFKGVGDGWILNDRVVVGVQLRLVSRCGGQLSSYRPSLRPLSMASH